MKLLVAVVILAAACGSKSPSTTTTPKEGGGGAAVALPDLAFDKLDHDQRIEFMKQKVMPVTPRRTPRALAASRATRSRASSRPARSAKLFPVW
jgi:hypothetical protein